MIIFTQYRFGGLFIMKKQFSRSLGLFSVIVSVMMIFSASSIEIPRGIFMLSDSFPVAKEN